MPEIGRLYGIIIAMYYDAVSAEYLEDYKLKIWFADGKSGLVEGLAKLPIDNHCHSERSEESLIFSRLRSFTPFRMTNKPVLQDPLRATTIKLHRVGGVLANPVLPHHRAYGSVHGGS